MIIALKLSDRSHRSPCSLEKSSENVTVTTNLSTPRGFWQRFAILGFVFWMVSLTGLVLRLVLVDGVSMQTLLSVPAPWYAIMALVALPTPMAFVGFLMLKPPSPHMWWLRGMAVVGAMLTLLVWSVRIL